MKTKLYVDNHMIQAGTPFVLEDENGEKQFAKKVTVFGSFTTEFNPDGERPNCFVVFFDPIAVHWHDNEATILLMKPRGVR